MTANSNMIPTNVVRQARFKKVPSHVSFATTGAEQKEIPVPAKLISGVLITVSYAVTDAGISAGETLDGCIEEVFLGQDNGNYAFLAKRDELIELVKFSNAKSNVPAGKYNCVMPTTATTQTDYFFIKGPFDLRRFEAPKLSWSMRPITDEFGAATVFNATVKAYIIEGEGRMQPVIFRRAASASGTSHVLDPGPGILGDMLIIGSTLSYIDRVTVEDAKNQVQYAYFDDYRALAANYAIMTASTTLVAKHILPGVNAPLFTGRTVQIVCGTAEAEVIFCKNYV